MPMVHGTAPCHLHACLQFHLKVVEGRCLFTLPIQNILGIVWRSLRFSPADTFLAWQLALAISGLFISIIVAAAATLWKLRWDIHEEIVDSNKHEILWGVRLCFSFLPSGWKESTDLRLFYNFHTCRHELKLVNIWRMWSHLIVQCK